jgi:threonylcarbamoyladenosine tRNA methylthiotransferase MtaB
MNISYYNIGCKLNFAEIATIQKELETKGHKTVPFASDEDAVIINTCTVTNRADADSRKIIRKALRNNPDAFIAVIGCYAQKKPNDIAAIKGVDVVFGMKEKYDVIDYIDSFKEKKEPSVFVSGLKDLPFHSACSVDNESRTRMVMKLQDGCDYSCTFCTIPKARGNSRSMPFDELKKRFAEFSDSDKYEIVLSGVNLGEYLSSTGETFIDVVKFIESAGLKQRIRISSIEPNLLKSEILEIVKKSKTFCHHFHIPLQSGSPDILKKMKRRYSVDFFKRLILNIKESIPDVCLGIDVIVGFPGETDEYFRETYDLLDSLPITYLHVFTYSERKNTPAANMQNSVPHDIRKSRTLALRMLSDKKRTQFYKSQIGTVHTFIPEVFNEKGKTWSGWTDNYVHIELKALPSLETKPYQIRLTELKGNKVYAELV